MTGVETDERRPPATCPACGAARLRLRYRLARFDVWACDACTMLFRHPLPDEREIAAMYEDARYLEGAYFADGRRRGRRESPEIVIYRRGLAELARLGARGRLLDVGCGSGVFLDLARRAGWQVNGIELSERHAAHARTAYGVEVWQGDFLSAPVGAGSFDAVTMWDFLEHVLDPAAALAWAHRLLRSGGVLLVFTIDTTSLFNLTGDALYRLTAGGAVRPLELLYDARHNYYFTPASLTRLVERAGFRVERSFADRAHLGRWLSEPAPWYVYVGGLLVDAASMVAGRPYRRTLLCRHVDPR